MKREEAIKELLCIRKHYQYIIPCEETIAIDMAIEALSERTGEWIEHEWAEEYDGLLISNYECTNCHSWERNNTDFCPNCGADMRKDK